MKVVAAACSGLVCLASLAFAEDFKTIDGKEYKDVTLTRVEPDGIVLTSKSGISKIYFTELPKEVQQRFKYDPEKAAAYSADQNVALEQARKQQEEEMRKKVEVMQKEQAGMQWNKDQRENVKALQARYQQLQQQEDDLLRRKGEAEQPGPAYWGGKSHRTLLHYPNPLASQLPLLESHLKDVRREKDRVRKQLEEAQRQ